MINGCSLLFFGPSCDHYDCFVSIHSNFFADFDIFFSRHFVPVLNISVFMNIVCVF